MAVAKRKLKAVKKDAAHMDAHLCTCQPSPIHKHLFLGGAITLLLVLATAQFALSRITWEEVLALKGESEAIAVPVPSEKEVVVSVTTKDFKAQVPMSFSLTQEQMDFPYYTIGTYGPDWGGVSAVIYQEKDIPSVQLLTRQTGGDGYLARTERVEASNGITYVVEYIYDTGIDLNDEHISQLNTIIDSLEFIGDPVVAQ